MAAMAEEPAEKEPPQGLLVKHSRVELLERGIDPADPKYTCEDLFGSVTGAAFLDMVYSRCGAGEHSVPWFITGSDGSRRRNIFRSPMSRPIQESTANAYKQRILKEGLSQLASGPATALPVPCSVTTSGHFARFSGLQFLATS